MRSRMSFFLVLLFPMLSHASHALELGTPGWKLTAQRFHLSAVRDVRKAPVNDGKILRGNSTTPISFNPTAAVAIEHYLNMALVQDTLNTVPLILEIRKLSISDVVTANRHKISVDMLFGIARDMNGTPQELFELSVRPIQYKPDPLPAGSMESLITDGVHDLFMQLNQWITTNPEHPLLMRTTLLHFEQKQIKDDPDTILWSAGYRLNWTDFKGNDKLNSAFSAQSNCLYTLEKLPEFHGDTLLVRVLLNPCFTRKASWVHRDELQDTLLMHEQLHFDLCELFARLFRSEAAKLNSDPLNFDQQINAVFAQLWEKYQQEQDRYDEETQHGTITSEQVRWINETKSRLDELRSWQR